MSEFVGIAELKRLNLAQLEDFERWAEARDWGSFHRNHYDWWAFPIDQPSSMGLKYCVTPDAVAVLKHSEEFIGHLRRLAELLLLSWGWDATTGSPVPDPQPNQEWAGWPIRLQKCHRSLVLFGIDDLAEHVAKYARYLHDRGTRFEYNGKDLYPLIVG